MIKNLLFSDKENIEMKKLSMKWVLSGMVALITILLVAGPCMARTEFISIGTGGTGGIYYPYGGGVAEIWNKYVKGVRAVAEVTGASVENVKLADKGETVIGEVMGDVAVAGYKGLSKFEGKKKRHPLDGHHVSQFAPGGYPEKVRDYRYPADKGQKNQFRQPGQRHQFHG
jgi:hypothetical protein